MSRKPNPLYIPIPKKSIADACKDRWDIVRRCNGSRRAMVNFICDIGGYHGGRNSGPFAIEFNVAAYGADLDADSLWKLLSSDAIDVGPDRDLSPGHLTQVKALFHRAYEEHKDSLWQWGVEEAYEGWSDSDTPYETWTGERVEWTFGLYGRGGKHLCMESCEGIDLTVDTDDLETLLLQKGDGITYDISADSLRKLFIICVQNSCELTTKAAASEVQYRAAWRLWVSFVEDQIPAMLEAYEQRQQLGGRARAMLDHLPDFLEDDFKTICTLADITIGE